MRKAASSSFADLPEKWNGLRVPRLILQPVLENAFKYGLENRAENGLLRVSFCEAGQSLRRCVEDNGEEKVDIAVLWAAVEATDAAVISGLNNIHRRLQIYFQGRGALRVARSALGGLAVIIELPGEAARPGERARYAYVMLLEPEDWFQGQTYVDVMNPKAIRRFIDVTHEAYYREVGAAFC